MENTEDLWFFLNHQITKGIDIYKIAKKNKLLPKGFTKDYYNTRGGILIDHISTAITKDSSIKELFN